MPSRSSSSSRSYSSNDHHVVITGNHPTTTQASRRSRNTETRQLRSIQQTARAERLEHIQAVELNAKLKAELNARAIKRKRWILLLVLLSIAAAGAGIWYTGAWRQIQIGDASTVQRWWERLQTSASGTMQRAMAWAKETYRNGPLNKTELSMGGHRILETLPEPTTVQEAARNLAAVAPQVYGPLPAFGPDLPAGGLPIHQTHPYGSIPIATHLPSTSRFRGALNPLATLIKKRKRSNSDATGSINQNRRALRYWHADPVRQGRDHIPSGSHVSSRHSRGVVHSWNSQRPLHHLGEIENTATSGYHGKNSNLTNRARGKMPHRNQ